MPMLLSRYQTKRSALSTTPPPSSAKIRQLFNQPANNTKANNTQISDSPSNFNSQSIFEDSFDFEIPEIKILYQNHSKILCTIDYCANLAFHTDPRRIKQKSLCLSELPQLLAEEFKYYEENSTYYQYLKRKTLNMIFQSLINSHGSYSSFSKMLRNYTYCDNYDDAPLDQSSQLSFTKDCFQILLAITIFLTLDDIKNVIQYLDDPTPTESEYIVVLINKFITSQPKYSYDLYNFIGMILQDLNKVSASMIAVLLPVYQKMISIFVVSNRNLVAKSLVKVIIPLIKHPNFQIFSGQFANLIQSTNDAFMNLRKSVAFNLIRYFPVTNVKKQVLFLSFLLQYINDLTLRDFSKNEKVHSKFIQIIATSIQSPSTYLSQAALRFFGQRVTRQLLINSKSNFKKLLDSVNYCFKQHWSPSIQKESSFTLSLLRKTNKQWYDEITTNNSPPEQFILNTKQFQMNNMISNSSNSAIIPKNANLELAKTKSSNESNRPLIISLSCARFNTGLSSCKSNSINVKRTNDFSSPIKKINENQLSLKREKTLSSPKFKLNDDQPLRRTNDSQKFAANGVKNEIRNQNEQSRRITFIEEPNSIDSNNKLVTECDYWIRIIQIANYNDSEIDSNKFGDLVKIEFNEKSKIQSKHPNRRASTSYCNRRDLNFLTPSEIEKLQNEDNPYDV